MEQPTGLAEPWKRTEPRVCTRPDLTNCAEAAVNNLDQLGYDTKLPLGYFYSFTLNGRKSLKPSKTQSVWRQNAWFGILPPSFPHLCWGRLDPLQLTGWPPSPASISLRLVTVVTSRPSFKTSALLPVHRAFLPR